MKTTTDFFITKQLEYKNKQTDPPTVFFWKKELLSSDGILSGWMRTIRKRKRIEVEIRK